MTKRYVVMFLTNSGEYEMIHSIPATSDIHKARANVQRRAEEHKNRFTADHYCVGELSVKLID